MYLKSSCPKCGGGFFYREEDEKTCVNCGFIRYDSPPLPFVANLENRKSHYSRPVGSGNTYGKQGHLSLGVRGERARSG